MVGNQFIDQGFIVFLDGVKQVLDILSRQDFMGIGFNKFGQMRNQYRRRIHHGKSLHFRHTLFSSLIHQAGSPKVGSMVALPQCRFPGHQDSSPDNVRHQFSAADINSANFKAIAIGHQLQVVPDPNGTNINTKSRAHCFLTAINRFN
jgi:hypothetical protein